MSRIGAAEALIKNIPSSSARPLLIKQLVTANVVFYGYYHLVSGPHRQSLKRSLTLSPGSGIQSWFTYHFCHTSALPLVFNSAVMATFGAYPMKAYGC